MHTSKDQQGKRIFSKYQVFLIAILAILQFTVILDFMVLSPLGVLLLDKLHITTAQFGVAVSAYAFSAGAAGILSAGFADKFDRKKFLLFFYTGFLAGTLLCAIAWSYEFLLVARIITGIFGGVISSVTLAIITDNFKMEVRGRVMGFVQMAFAASQILGLPIGLTLAKHFGWHAPFWMIVGFGSVVGIAVYLYLQPVKEHLALKQERNAFQHLTKTVTHPHYPLAFLATTLLATGGFMLMPFGSAFAIHNIKLNWDQLTIVYAVTGMFTIVMGPLIGKLSDTIGKYKTFCIGSVITIIMVFIYVRLDSTPLALVICMNVFLFMGILSRSISASALSTAVPEPSDRGAFMSINAAVQQISGGIAAAVAGLIVVQEKSGKILHYDTVGYVVIGSVIISAFMMYTINKYVKEKNKRAGENVKASTFEEYIIDTEGI